MALFTLQDQADTINANPDINPSELLNALVEAGNELEGFDDGSFPEKPEVIQATNLKAAEEIIPEQAAKVAGEETKQPILPEGKPEAGVLPLSQEQKGAAIEEHPVLGRIFTSGLFRGAAGAFGEPLAKEGEKFQKQAEEEGFLPAAGRVITEEAAGAITGIPQATTEVLDFFSRGLELGSQPIETAKALFTGDFEKLPERGVVTGLTLKFAEAGRALTDLTQDLLGIDKESAAVKVGELLAPTAAEIALISKVPKAVKAVSEAAKPAIKATGEAIETGVKKVGEVAEETAASLKAARQAEIAADAETAAGQIVQGKTKDIEKGKRALGQIDATDVKTFDELEVRLNENVEVLSGKVDDKLLENTTKFKPKDISTKTKVGTKTITETPIEDSLNQLIETFEKGGKKIEAEESRQLLTRFKSEGLSLKEMNDITRTHGREVASGAFTKAGEPTTSISKQSFENTRKKSKDAIRNQMPDDATKAFDSQISDSINTRTLVGKMKEKVNTLQQKVTERGLGESFGRTAVQILDAISFGSLRGVATAILPSNVGLKTLNSLDLQEQLPKLLKLIDKANAADSPTLFEKALKEFNKAIPAVKSTKGQLDVGSIAEDLGKTKSATTKTIPKELEGLAKEARKFKTAEEFQQVVFADLNNANTVINNQVVKPSGKFRELMDFFNDVKTDGIPSATALRRFHSKIIDGKNPIVKGVIDKDFLNAAK